MEYSSGNKIDTNSIGSIKEESIEFMKDSEDLSRNKVQDNLLQPDGRSSKNILQREKLKTFALNFPKNHVRDAKLTQTVATNSMLIEF